MVVAARGLPRRVPGRGRGAVRGRTRRPPAVRPPGTVEVLASGLSHTPAVTSPRGSGNGPGPASWAAALTVAAAVAAFLELASPGHGHAAGHPGYAAAAGLGAAATGAGALAAAVAGLRAAGRRRAVFLAVARGWRIPARRW